MAGTTQDLMVLETSFSTNDGRQLCNLMAVNCGNATFSRLKNDQNVGEIGLRDLGHDPEGRPRQSVAAG